MGVLHDIMFGAGAVRAFRGASPPLPVPRSCPAEMGLQFMRKQHMGAMYGTVSERRAESLRGAAADIPFWTKIADLQASWTLLSPQTSPHLNQCKIIVQGKGQQHYAAWKLERSGIIKISSSESSL